MCTEYIISDAYDVDSLELYCVAQRYGLDEAAEESLHKVSNQNVPTLEENPLYLDLNKDIKLQILRERITKLEALLGEFASTCSNIINQVYNSIVNKLDNYQCSRRKLHSKETTEFGSTQTKRFDHDCYSCKNIFDTKWPEKYGHVKHLRSSFSNLGIYIGNCRYYHVSY